MVYEIILNIIGMFFIPHIYVQQITIWFFIAQMVSGPNLSEIMSFIIIYLTKLVSQNNVSKASQFTFLKKQQHVKKSPEKSIFLY